MGTFGRWSALRCCAYVTSPMYRTFRGRGHRRKTEARRSEFGAARHFRPKRTYHIDLLPASVHLLPSEHEVFIATDELTRGLPVYHHIWVVLLDFGRNQRCMFLERPNSSTSTVTHFSNTPVFFESSTTPDVRRCVFCGLQEACVSLHWRRTFF